MGDNSSYKDVYVTIGTPRWYAIEQELNRRSDCIDFIPLLEAVLATARMYNNPWPVREDEVTCEESVELDAIILAVGIYTDLTDDEIAALE